MKSSTGVYTTTPKINGFLDLLNYKKIPARDSDYLIKLDEKYEHAPDLLALDLYGDPELWWIIPQRNGLQDPIFDLTKDRNLMIPTFETVKSIF
jgi:hypothetical protein